MKYAIKPKEVATRQTGITINNAVIEEINNQVMDIDNDISTCAIIEGELNVKDKVYLKTIYREAGWKDVEVTNLLEGGEKAGLWKIKLYW